MKEKIKKIHKSTKHIVTKHTQFKPVEHIWTFIGAFVGIAVLGLIQGTQFGNQDNIFLIGSFGASAVLVYGAPTTPFAQPRNLIGGHLVCALIGVSIHTLTPGNYWLAAALAVSLSIVAMQITKTMHPPGGATALIANIGSDKIKGIGFGYILSPILTGVVVLFIVAMVVNNIPKSRRYPIREKNE